MKDKYYYKDGDVLDYRDYDKELHRIDGPAIEREDGSIWVAQVEQCQQDKQLQGVDSTPEHLKR